MLDNEQVLQDEGYEEQEEYEEQDDYGEEEGVEGEEDDQTYRDQEDFDKAFERRFARERRKLAKQMGFNNLEEAVEYASAGRAVTSASGLSPSEVRQRLAEQQAAQQSAAPVQTQGGDDVRKEINEIKSILSDEREEKMRTNQATEARKEFGKLYDEYREDIEDKAEETGLSLLDAATLVLRPKLKQHIEQQSRKKKEVQRKRKVEGGDSKPPTEIDYSTALTDVEKATAKRMGRTLEQYYNRKKQLGEIE